MENKGVASRIKEAIENGPAKQVKIADYCEVSLQSVGAWKRTGQITRDNLRKLSEITGFRYIWLKTGNGPKRFNDPSENRDEFELAEEQGPYGAARSTLYSPATQRLLDSLTYALANNRLTEESIDHLASFIASLTKS